MHEVYRSMLGAFVGDAAGGTLEFMDNITPDMAKAAMKMSGGGLLDLGSGQITDDGELTLAAWQHLVPFRDGLGIPVTNLIRAYVEWYRSHPFDMGRTCSIAFGEASKLVSKINIRDELNYDHWESFRSSVKEFNKNSEANGALMRASALATWVSILEYETPNIAKDIATADAEISHPNIVCVEVNQIYVKTIVYLLSKLSPQETLAKITDFINKEITSLKVKNWFFEESLNIDNLNCKVNAGHVRYGFVLAMYFLRNPHIRYEDAIYQTLLKGGDTDTNACIVGGLVACYHEIPEYMLRPVIEFDCTLQDQLRPEMYSVKKLLNGELYEYIKSCYA